MKHKFGQLQNLFQQNAATFLAFLPDRLLRLDVNAAQGAEFWRCVRPQGKELPFLIEMLLNLGPAFKPNIWILDSELWTQVLPIPTRTIVDLSEEETARALGFEVEPYSGIPALESHLVFRQLGEENGETQFWVTQVPQTRFDSLLQDLSRWGTRLAGWVHPGGLLQPIFLEESRESWARLEFWPEVIFYCQSNLGGAPQLNVLNSDPRQNNWQISVGHWFADLESIDRREFLNSLPQSSAEHPPFDSLDWRSDDVLQKWLELQAQDLKEGFSKRPVIQAPKRRLTTLQKAGAVATLQILVILLCWLHFTGLQSDHQELTIELAQIRDPAVLEKQIRQDQGGLETLKAYRQKWSHLLERIAHYCPENLVLQEIIPQTDTTLLRGSCLFPELANQFASQLGKDLSVHGWQVQPPQKQAQNLLENGGPWTFEMALTTQTTSSQKVIVAPWHQR